MGKVTQCGRELEGAAAQQSVLRGGSNPLPFSVPRIPSIDKWYPFRIPS